MSGTSGVGGPIWDAERATPEWLTLALRRSGAAGDSRVVRRSVTRTLRTGTADLYWLALEYDPGAPPLAPAGLVLKLARADAEARSGAKEVQFYERVAPEMPNPPVPRCFDIGRSTGGREWHLLLEDVSQGREQPPYNLPPTEPMCGLAVDSLAQLHAHWWEHPRLGRDVGERPTDVTIEAAAERAERTAEAFVAFLGDRLPPARRRVYDRLLAGQRALRRRQMARPLTLVHGDPHWWNFFYPQASSDGTGTQGPAILYDWEMWGVAPAASDLAHAIANAWFPERRQRLEQPLLRRYHAGLLEHGVGDHTWNECWDDYRLFVATNPFTPAFQWRRGTSPLVWWANLERAMLSFEDLGCEEFVRA